MEQPCYKCGQAVEEGVAFCPHCSAPQIRVVIAEAPAAAAPAAEAALPRLTPDRPASETVPALAIPLRWSRAVGPCALAALVACLLMVLKLYPLVAFVSAGFLAVVFYRQRQGGVAILPSAGARLGALSGLISFGVLALLTALASTVPGAREEMRKQLIENAQKWSAPGPADPQVQELIAQLKTPEGFVTIMIAGAVALFVLSILLSTLGGALGAKIFSRRDKP
jgi:hypothetical protein